jgi:hypothetical protein
LTYVVLYPVVLCAYIALMFEKRKDFGHAMEGYMNCLAECGASVDGSLEHSRERDTATAGGAGAAGEASGGAAGAEKKKYDFMKELRGEVMLRIAVLRKEMGALDQSMQMCNNVAADNFSDSIRVNALCLKVID